MTILEQTIEQVLLDRIKQSGDGEHTYLGSPRDLITELGEAVKDLLLKQVPTCDH